MKKYHPWFAIRGRVRSATRKTLFAYLRTRSPEERVEIANLAIQADINPDDERPAKLRDAETAALEWKLMPKPPAAKKNAIKTPQR